MNSINGARLRDMIVSAANNVENHKSEINDLNVFPVPDGDTGSNMAMTVQAAKKPLMELESPTCGQVADVTASTLLKSARGNSGVITSLLFRGIAKEIAGAAEMDAMLFARALDGGVKAAYSAVMKPTEGTILTVSRLSAERALVAARAGGDLEQTMEVALEAARETLSKTPDMLPVLKSAGVVDSGGMGYVRILEGMASALLEGVVIQTAAAEPAARQEVQHHGGGHPEKVNLAALNPEDIEFAYCTEFFINRTDSKRLRDVTALRDALDKMGDSLVFVDDGDIVKIHVHSNAPGRVLQQALKYGYLSGIKVENMIEQYGEFVEQMAPERRTVAEPVKPYGFVAVSPGPGLTELFKELLADQVVSGGQTMNPAMEDIAAAIDATPAETVFVLPNNKNIILTAEMAAKVSEKDVRVLPCSTVPEGVVALVNFDESATPDQNVDSMKRAAAAVKSGQVTYAVRDSTVSGKKVRQGDMMGLWNSNLVALDRSPEKAALKLLAEMAEEGAEFVTIFYGSDVSAQTAEKLEEQIQKKFGSKFELSLVDGGQPVYSYLISVE